MNYGLDAFDMLFSPELASRLTHLSLCLLHTNDEMSGTGDNTIPFRWNDFLALVTSTSAFLVAVPALQLG